MTALRAALTRTRLLGRDPVMTIAVVVSAAIGAIPALGLPDNLAGALTAVLAALGGVLSAWLVSVDRALPLLTGLGKAVIVLIAAFGLQLPATWVAGLLAVLTLIGGLATRAQVSAVQPARGRDADGTDFVLLDRDATYSVTTDLSFEHDETDPHKPLPPATDDTQPGHERMAWTRGEPATEYLPRTGDSQAQQHRPGESTGRHRAEWWPEKGGTLNLGT